MKNFVKGKKNLSRNNLQVDPDHDPNQTKKSHTEIKTKKKENPIHPLLENAHTPYQKVFRKREIMKKKEKNTKNLKSIF